MSLFIWDDAHVIQDRLSFQPLSLKLLLVLLVCKIILTLLSPPCLLFSSSILWPTQLLTQSRAVGLGYI